MQWRQLSFIVLLALTLMHVLPARTESVSRYGEKRAETPGKSLACGTYRGRVEAALVHSRIRHALRERIAEAASRFKTYVAGNVVVLEDDGALVSEPSVHPFDLDGQGLRFTPNSAGGYDVTMTPVQFDTVLGVDLTAGDDTNHRVAFSSVFTFPFFGRNWDHVWVTSNGNVTFGAPGTEGRFNELDFFLELPMIAAFFTDLDPSRIGSVFYRQEPDRFVVTWDGITEFGNFNSNTLQLTAFPGRRV